MRTGMVSEMNETYMGTYCTLLSTFVNVSNFP